MFQYVASSGDVLNNPGWKVATADITANNVQVEGLIGVATLLFMRGTRKTLP